jgi:hypothetical protein
MMAQQSVPGVAASNDTSNMSGQAGGGGGGSVFGDLGGTGQQHAGAAIPDPGDFPRNAGGHPTNNPSGGAEWGAVPPLDSVFGTDLGGSGVARETGGQMIPNIAPATGPPGQGGR